MKKYESIVAQLKKEVSDGVFNPGDRFYSDSQLIKKFKVSNTTVEYAVKAMVNDGLLERINGKGTFIREYNSHGLKDMFALIMRKDGHLFDDLFKAVVRRFQASDHYSMIYYSPVRTGDHFSVVEDNKRNLQKLIENDLSGLLIDGVYDLPFDYLAQSRNAAKMIFLHRYEADRELDANYVLSDYWRGGYLAAKHLINRGYKRIVYFTHQGLAFDRSSYKLLSGFQVSCAESGLGVGKDVRIVFDLDGDQEELRAVLESGWSPDAIFAVSDFRIARVMPLFSRLGLRIPEDLALMGYNDTPWATSLEVPLTSVNLKLDEIADRTCDIALRLAAGETLRERHIIEPEVVERAST